MLAEYFEKDFEIAFIFQHEPDITRNNVYSVGIFKGWMGSNYLPTIGIAQFVEISKLKSILSIGHTGMPGGFVHAHLSSKNGHSIATSFTLVPF